MASLKKLTGILQFQIDTAFRNPLHCPVHFFNYGDLLNRIARQIFELILVGGIVSLLRAAQFAVQGRSNIGAPAAAPALPLHRDPLCGMHVSPQISFQARHQGEVAHFCSAECREKYLRSGPQLTGA